jgi:hypothetical protein
MHMVLVVKCEGKRTLARRSHRWEHILKWTYPGHALDLSGWE